MRKFIYISACVLITLGANAQNAATSKLLWSTSIVVDRKGNANISYQSSIKSDGKSIDWTQGLKTYHYTITQVVGSWTTITSDGQLICKVTAGTKTTGSFTFSKSGTDIKVRLQTLFNGDPDLDLEFTISAVQLN